MRVTKASQAGEETWLGREELEQINRLARRELTEGEVYAFSVRLCDNEVDRDGERFEPETLEELAGLFVGKCGIFDHRWSAKGQAARIYRTELVREPEKLTKAGDGYCWLKGYAYMMRTESNRDLIAEIEGGIKKEVSVGCAVERSECSICGADRRNGDCGHKKGERYDGALCFTRLMGASDAYEFSFVAVPAQPAAGIVKGMEGRFHTLKALAEGHPECAGELERLEREALLGRKSGERARREAVRFGLLAGLGLDKAALERLVAPLSPEELEQVEKAWEQKAAERYPLFPQLRYEEREQKETGRDGAFLI